MTKARDLSVVPNQSLAFKNRLINGAMVFDQRNNGASLNVTGGHFPVDRWQATTSQSSRITVGRNLNSVTPPAGFNNYLGVQVTSAFTPSSSDFIGLYQSIEGFNLNDLALGTANAQPFTVSFWARSSVTGAFSVAASASYAANASYVTTYTINQANTWEYKTITIPGTAIGTWARDNSLGMFLWFDLGCGSNLIGTANTWSTGYTLRASGSTALVQTNGAVLYITGVQLEVGSNATSFDYRPYGTELALCQRYYQNNFASNTAMAFFDAVQMVGWKAFIVTMRAAPTMSLSSGTTASVDITGVTSSSITPTFDSITANGFRFYGQPGGSYTVGRPGALTGTNVQASAEL